MNEDYEADCDMLINELKAIELIARAKGIGVIEQKARFCRRILSALHDTKEFTIAEFMKITQRIKDGLEQHRCDNERLPERNLEGCELRAQVS